MSTLLGSFFNYLLYETGMSDVITGVMSGIMSSVNFVFLFFKIVDSFLEIFIITNFILLTSLFFI